MKEEDLIESLKSLTEEIATRNKREFTPNIRASLAMVGPVYVELALRNIGKTAAVNVSVEFRLEPGSYKKKWIGPLLMPGESVQFFLPEGEYEKLQNKYDYLKVSGTCQNLFGESFNVKSTLSVKEILKSWKESRLALEYDSKHYLKDIGKKLDGLERTLNRMKAFTGGVLVKTPSDELKEEEDWRKRVEEMRAKKQPKKKRTIEGEKA